MGECSEKLEPKSLWNHFEKICSIPHASKKEEPLAKYVYEWGRGLGLETLRDEFGNVLIRKGPTKGMEKRPSLVLQAHLDMVCEKNNATVHDFDRDPIRPYIDGDWVKARGTTLGADNGIAAAAMMSVLESKDVEHGPLECLFTLDEETGLSGAQNLKPGFLRSGALLNLDSEDDDELCIGCAGGMDTVGRWDYGEERMPQGHVGLEITLSGLLGGHSGVDIILGRGNANQIMVRLLWGAQKEFGLRVCSLQGGSKRNAIPREGSATVIVKTDKKSEFIAFCQESVGKVINELGSADPGLKLNVKEQPSISTCWNETAQKKILDALYLCPHGVMAMCADMPGLVQTSTNLAIIRREGAQIVVETSQRSSIESDKLNLVSRVEALFAVLGAQVTHSSSYSGWKPDVNSKLLQVCQRVYREHYGKEPHVRAIHAGLECGIIKQSYPDMDMLSIGPTMKFPHSPDEKVSIPSVKRFWGYLKQVLKNIE